MSDHTHTYAPCIRVGGSLLDLTDGYTPLVQVSQQYTNRVRLSTVPLENGGIIFDIRRGPCTVAFQGVIHGVEDSEELRTKMDTLHQYLCGGSGTPSKFTFYRYYNASTGNYRFWRNCACNDLAFDDGSRTKMHMPYSFSLTSEDGFEFQALGTVGTHDPDVPAVSTTLLGPRLVKLDDDAGLSAFTVLNSAGAIVFKVDSLGNATYVGEWTQVLEIT